MFFELSLGLISKQNYQKICNLTIGEYKQLFPDMIFIDCLDKADVLSVELVLDSEYQDIIIKNSNDFFDYSVTQAYFTQEDPLIIGKNGLEMLILSYQHKVIEQYEQMFKPTVDDALMYERYDLIELRDGDSDFSMKDNVAGELVLMKVADMFERRLTAWKKGRVLNKYGLTDSLTKSSEYEYAVFDLVRLLKTIDFDRYHLVMYRNIIADNYEEYEEYEEL